MRLNSPVGGICVAGALALSPVAQGHGLHHTHKQGTQSARATVPVQRVLHSRPVMTLARPEQRLVQGTTQLYYVPPVAGRYYIPQPFTFPATPGTTTAITTHGPALSGIPPLSDPVPQGFLDNWGWEPVRSIADLAPRMVRQP